MFSLPLPSFLSVPFPPPLLSHSPSPPFPTPPSFFLLSSLFPFIPFLLLLFSFYVLIFFQITLDNFPACVNSGGWLFQFFCTYCSHTVTKYMTNWFLLATILFTRTATVVKRFDDRKYETGNTSERKLEWLLHQQIHI